MNIFKNKYYIFSILIIVSIFIGCNDKSDEDIKIGFIAGLSGKYSNLGSSVRDGLLLAFDEIDYKIDDKKIKIIQKDDKQNKDEAKKSIDSLIKSNVKIIVGNATSSMTTISLDAIKDKKDILLFSATASSNNFTGKDDNFIRVQLEQSTKKHIKAVNYLIKNNYKKVYLIYDSTNMSYVNGYKNIFQKLFVSKGGEKFVGSSNINNDYKNILNDLNSQEYDLILVVANSIDSANIIQYIRLNKINKKILSSGWAKTRNFIQNGGKAVEGVLFSTSYDEQSKDKGYIEFVNNFKNKYNVLPSSSAAQGYEVGKIIIENLKISSNPEKLKNRILNIKKYNGVQGDIIFDKYGDIFREYFMMTIKDSKYIKL